MSVGLRRCPLQYSPGDYPCTLVHLFRLAAHGLRRRPEAGRDGPRHHRRHGQDGAERRRGEEDAVERARGGGGEKEDGGGAPAEQGGPQPMVLRKTAI